MTTELPDDSPELQYGMFVYEGGIMQTKETTTVTGITIENEGTLEGVENLIIGPLGVIILRYFPFVFVECLFSSASSWCFRCYFGKCINWQHFL